MSTTQTNLGLIESVQDALISKNVRDFFPNVTTNYFSGMNKGDTVKVQLIAGSAGQFDKTSNNYFSGSGSVTAIDVVLNRHAVQVFEIEQENLDKVSYDSIVKAAVDAVMKEVTADIWGAFTVANYTATPDVIGLFSAFDYDAAISAFDNIDAQEMEKATLALKPEYINNLVKDQTVALALANEGKMLSGVAKASLLGVELQKTKRIPAGTNVVGAIFAPESLALAFGSPTGEAGVITEVADDVTGFRLYVREVKNHATGTTNVAVECVYGLKPALIEKAVILKSA